MKRILITGGTGTLGGALTRELCARGHEVTAGFRANEARAVALSEETGCALWQGDMSDEAEVESLFQSQEFAAVLHCAGWNRNDLLARLAPRTWEDILDSHLTSSFLICRAGLRFLPRGGQILLVSSRVGLVGNVGQSAYASAKTGVFGLMKTAAIEGQERGIRVNAICPGFAPNEGEILAPLQQNKRTEEEILAHSDARESFAAFVAWFLGSNSEMSGQILRPDCRI